MHDADRAWVASLRALSSMPTDEALRRLIEAHGLAPADAWHAGIGERVALFYGALWRTAQRLRDGNDDSGRAMGSVIQVLCFSDFVFRITQRCKNNEPIDPLGIEDVLDSLRTPLQETLSHVRKALHAQILQPSAFSRSANGEADPRP